MKHDPYTKNLRICIFDIETTGLFSARDRIISASFCDPDSLELKQLFCESPSLEKNTVSDILRHLADYDAVITYNGASFDLPFLKARAEHYGLRHDLNLLWNTDVFRRLKKYWPAAQTMTSLRQTAVEEALGLAGKRDDTLRGSDCIALYARYQQLGEEKDRQAILLHNADDVRQLARISNAVNFLPWHRIALDEGFPAFPKKRGTDNTASRELPVMTAAIPGMPDAPALSPEPVIVRSTAIKNNTILASAVMPSGLMPAAFYQDGWRMEYDTASGRVSLAVFPENMEGLSFVDLRALPVDEQDFMSLSGYDSGFLVLLKDGEPCPAEINALSRQLLKQLL